MRKNIKYVHELLEEAKIVLDGCLDVLRFQDEQDSGGMDGMNGM